MKQFFVIIFLFFFSNNLYCQNYSEDFTKYQVAFNHIINDSINKDMDIYLSDTLVTIYIGFFEKELKEERIIKDSLLYCLMYSEIYDEILLEKLSTLNNHDRSKNILHFSPIINKNIILGQIIFSKDIYIRESKRWITDNSESLIYLFVFDENDSIKQVFKIDLIYDSF